MSLTTGRMTKTVMNSAKPVVIIAGGSSYPRAIDYAAFKAIATEVGALLMADIAHPAGLLAAGVNEEPTKLSKEERASELGKNPNRPVFWL